MTEVEDNTQYDVEWYPTQNFQQIASMIGTVLNDGASENSNDYYKVDLWVSFANGGTFVYNKKPYVVELWENGGADVVEQGINGVEEYWKRVANEQYERAENLESLYLKEVNRPWWKKLLRVY